MAWSSKPGCCLSDWSRRDFNHRVEARKLREMHSMSALLAPELRGDRQQQEGWWYGRRLGCLVS